MTRAELISPNVIVGMESFDGFLRTLVIPMIGEAAQPIWTLGIFARALTVALLLGLMGGLYPALKATSLEPVKALRYE